MPATLPHDALRIANATLPDFPDRSPAFALSFAHVLTGDCAAEAHGLSTSEAVMLAVEVEQALRRMAETLAPLARDELSPVLLRALIIDDLRPVLERAFLLATRVALRPPVQQIVVDAWHVLFMAMVHGVQES